MYSNPDESPVVDDSPNRLLEVDTGMITNLRSVENIDERREKLVDVLFNNLAFNRGAVLKDFNPWTSTRAYHDINPEWNWSGGLCLRELARVFSGQEFHAHEEWSRLWVFDVSLYSDKLTYSSKPFPRWLFYRSLDPRRKGILRQDEVPTMPDRRFEWWQNKSPVLEWNHNTKTIDGAEDLWHFVWESLGGELPWRGHAPRSASADLEYVAVPVVQNELLVDSINGHVSVLVFSKEDDGTYTMQLWDLNGEKDMGKILGLPPQDFLHGVKSKIREGVQRARRVVYARTSGLLGQFSSEFPESVDPRNVEIQQADRERANSIFRKLVPPKPGEDLCDRFSKKYSFREGMKSCLERGGVPDSLWHDVAEPYPQRWRARKGGFDAFLGDYNRWHDLGSEDPEQYVLRWWSLEKAGKDDDRRREAAAFLSARVVYECKAFVYWERIGQYIEDGPLPAADEWSENDQACLSRLHTKSDYVGHGGVDPMFCELADKTGGGCMSYASAMLFVVAVMGGGPAIDLMTTLLDTNESRRKLSRAVQGIINNFCIRSIPNSDM